MNRLIKSVLLLSLAVLFGCKSNQSLSNPRGNPGEFQRVQGKGIENLYSLGGTLYSGASPEGEQGFATLQKLGIRTLISVDGLIPRADMAAKYGMQYVHLPM